MSGGATAVTIAAAAISAVGQIMSQRAQEKTARKTAEYNAQVAANEAATQQQLAQNEVSKGIAERDRQQRAAARAMGEMRANMGASGFEMDSGSNLALLEESAAEHQYDSSIITQNANMAAWGHQAGATAANNNQAFAQFQKANASANRAGAWMGAGGTLLGGIGNGIGQYHQINSLTKKTD